MMSQETISHVFNVACCCIMILLTSLCIYIVLDIKFAISGALIIFRFAEFS